jgi:hypothetical protein
MANGAVSPPSWERRRSRDVDPVPDLLLKEAIINKKQGLRTRAGGRKAADQMSINKASIDVIGTQLRLQWADTLSEPMTTVLENLLLRFQKLEQRTQPKQALMPLPNIGEPLLYAVLCPSDESDRARGLLADLRSAIQRKISQNGH